MARYPPPVWLDADRGGKPGPFGIMVEMIFGSAAIAELDLARVFVGRHLLAAEGDELLGRGRLAGPQADVGLDGLAAVGVGHPDHGGLAHRFVLVEDVLDLARPYLVAAGVDLVFLP